MSRPTDAPFAGFLHNLASTLGALGIRHNTLADITGLEKKRITEISSRKYEPMLSEAHRIATALGHTTIRPLITSGNLTLSELFCGVRLPDDVDQMRAGRAMPLSLACRVAMQLGVEDPAVLIVTPWQRSMWHMMSRERACHTGKCPWCFEPVGYDHLDTCVAEAIWGPRDAEQVTLYSPQPHPIRPGKGQRASGRAPGLAHQRKLAGITPAQLHNMIGLRADYLSRIEKGRLNLTLDKAEQIARVLNCDTALLYATPAPETDA
jgi:DNA-binding XRE family transcriptional regulator